MHGAAGQDSDSTVRQLPHGAKFAQSHHYQTFAIIFWSPHVFIYWALEVSAGFQFLRIVTRDSKVRWKRSIRRYACGRSVTSCIEHEFSAQHARRMKVNVVGKVIYLFVYPLSLSPAHTASLSVAQATCSNLDQQPKYSTNLPYLRERR